MMQQILLGQGDSGYEIDDVFSVDLYNGSGSAQSINNGIDLSGKGGLVWIKTRTPVNGYVNHNLWDTNRGVRRALHSNTNSVENTSASSTHSLNQFNSNGFSLGSNWVGENNSGHTYVAWTFRQAKKFFDVVTYSGNNTSGRTIAHDLGITPGLIIIKCLNDTRHWWAFHRSLGNTGATPIFRNNPFTTAQAYWNNTSPTDSVFTLGNDVDVNSSGKNYVAYLFAHDTASDGNIQCGDYTGNGSTNGPTVNLGWRPQMIMVKKVSSGGWYMVDTARGINTNAVDPYLDANASHAEFDSEQFFNLTSTGFQNKNRYAATNQNGFQYIYVAIREA